MSKEELEIARNLGDAATLLQVPLSLLAVQALAHLFPQGAGLDGVRTDVLQFGLGVKAVARS